MHFFPLVATAHRCFILKTLYSSPVMTVHQFNKQTSTPAPSSSYARHYLTKHVQVRHGSQATSNAAMAKQGEATKVITTAQLSSYKDEFDSDIKNKLATLTISRESYTNALENREVFLEHPPVFSNKLAIDAPITNQFSSGRCWLFAVQYLLKDPIGDGGQWDMFVALIEKYGVVPKESYPETYHTSNSGQMDNLVTSRLREYAKILRNEYAQGKSASELRAHKKHMLEEVHRIMAISLGHPPEKLTWAFYDKDKKFHEFKDITPLQFYKDNVNQDCTNTVSLINDPRNDYMKKYTVDLLGNVVGAEQVHYINLPIDDIKRYAAAAIKAGRPVWFGCDVGKCHSRNKGMMDPDLIDYQTAFNFGPSTTKAERLQYGESLMTHAMVLTGVHVDGDQVVRWRIENSWGKDYGNSG
ncbi:bleomycin hydrolase, partial [Coemansia sp. RSA 2530]